MLAVLLLPATTFFGLIFLTGTTRLPPQGQPDAAGFRPL
jgi:hypothetical protein